ncbi:MAG: DUF58 domain-containing protein [Deltaproteobacteria bacterium]|nr:DUF58 domain-containing protein [Deltaproteobacteria bacterium]
MSRVLESRWRTGWRALRRFLRPPRSLKVTREGRYYIGLTFGVGFAAVNTGNNLLFLALGVLLALIVLSGLLSESALKRISLRLRLPPEIRAGEPTLVGLEVHNGNRLFPSIGLRFTAEPGEGYSVEEATLFHLPASSSRNLRLRVKAERRGELKLGVLRVTTRYPFGIFAKTRHLREGTTLLVWPGRGRATRLEPVARSRALAASRPRAGSGDELHALRPYRLGDEARQIHWRRSLRMGTLLIVERELSTGGQVRLVLRGPEGDDAAYEAAIRDAASTLEAHLQQGDAVALDTPSSSLGPGEGRAHRRRLLSTLALLPRAGAPRGGGDREVAA